MADARRGFLGFAKFHEFNTASGTSYPQELALRISGGSIKAAQEVAPEDLIDGRVDRTTYRLGPLTVDGDISFPLIHESLGDISFAEAMWQLAVGRGPLTGEMDSFSATLKYTYDTAYKYDQCLVNSMGVSVEAEGMVEMTANVIGKNRLYADASDPTLLPDYLSPARIVTWNDVSITGENLGADYTGSTTRTNSWTNQNNQTSQSIRSFSFDINNNVARYYTFNGQLAPEDIVGGKREVSGSLTMIGSLGGTAFNEWAYSAGNPNLPGGYGGNVQDYSSNSYIRFTVLTQAYTFDKRLNGVVYNIEDIEMTNDFFEANINFTAFAADEKDYLAISDV